MAALTDVSAISPPLVADGVSEPRARWASVCRPTGPEWLAEAGRLLPLVVGRGPVRCVDVHTALYEAACVLGAGRDRPHRLRLADEALELFVGFLVASGYAEPASRVRDAVRGWLLHASPVEAQLALAAAAAYWRVELRG